MRVWKDGATVQRKVVKYHGERIGTGFTTTFPKGGKSTYVYRSKDGTVAVARDWKEGPYSFHYEARGGARPGSANASVEGPFGLSVAVYRDIAGKMIDQVHRDYRGVVTRPGLDHLLAVVRDILATPTPREAKLLQPRR